MEDVRLGLAALGVFVGLVSLALGVIVWAAPARTSANRFLAATAVTTGSSIAEYRTVRKREVYRASFESATEDGEVTPKERALLATLADELGLGVRDVHDIEREAGKARAGVA